MSGYIWLISILMWLALEDIQSCRLKNRTLLLFSILGVIAAGVRWGIYGEITNFVDFAALGLLLGIMQKISKGQIGTGDIWVLAGLPLYIEETAMWESIWVSLLLMAVTAIIIYAEERNKKAGIPYIPFLCAGVIITMWRNFANGFY